MSAAIKSATKVAEPKTEVRKVKAKTSTTPSTRKKSMSKTSPTQSEVKKQTSTVMSTLASREDFFVQIQKEAYYLAEKDSFAGDPVSYWFAAEANVQRRMKSV